MYNVINRALAAEKKLLTLFAVVGWGVMCLAQAQSVRMQIDSTLQKIQNLLGIEIK